MNPLAVTSSRWRFAPGEIAVFVHGMIVALSFAVVLLPGRACAAGAEATRVDFVAVDQGAPDRRRRADPGPSCRVGIQAGMTRSSVQALERPAGDGVPLVPIPDVRLENSADASLQFDCPVDGGWRLGLAWREGRSRTSGTFADRRFSVQAGFSGPEAVLSRRLFRSTTGASLDAVLAVGAYRSHHREVIDDWRRNGVDRALGARVGLEASWGLSESLEVFARAEHVWLDFGRPEDSGDPTTATSGTSRSRIDFSGPAIGAGVRWSLR